MSIPIGQGPVKQQETGSVSGIEKGKTSEKTDFDGKTKKFSFPGLKQVFSQILNFIASPKTGNKEFAADQKQFAAAQGLLEDQTMFVFSGHDRAVSFFNRDMPALFDALNKMPQNLRNQFIQRNQAEFEKIGDFIAQNHQELKSLPGNRDWVANFEQLTGKQLALSPLKPPQKSPMERLVAQAEAKLNEYCTKVQADSFKVSNFNGRFQLQFEFTSKDAAENFFKTIQNPDSFQRPVQQENSFTVSLRTNESVDLIGKDSGEVRQYELGQAVLSSIQQHQNSQS